MADLSSGPAGLDTSAALAALPSGPVAAFGAAVLRRVDLPPGEGAVAEWAASVGDAFAFVNARRTDVAIRVLLPGGVALDGGRPQGSLIQIASVDRDFIITSVSEELRRRGLRSTRLLGVPFGATRDDEGHLTAIGAAREAEHVEGFIEVELDTRIDPDLAITVVTDLRRVLASVFLATGDHDAMRDAIRAVAEASAHTAPAVFDPDEVTESVALVDWLLDGHCVLLGVGRFPVTGSTPGLAGAGTIGPLAADTALGLLREPGSSLGAPPPRISGQLLDVTRLPEISLVHRQVPLGRFDLTLVDEQGCINGIGRLVCVFSRRAEASPVQTVPLLRWKLQQILEEEDAVVGSYDEQAVTSLFQALPKDDLFRAGVDELHATIRSLLAEDRDHRVRVLMQCEPGARAVSVLITMPSELYTRALRRRVESFLVAQLDGERVDVELAMGGSSDTVARFLVHLPASVTPPADLEAISREVRLLCRTWEQELTAALRDAVGDRAGRLASAWADRLPASYRDAVEANDAVDDILTLDDLNELDLTAGPALRVRFGDQSEPGSRLTVASAGAVVELSRLLPIVESLGLWVADELHWDVGGIGLHRLTVRRRDGAEIDVSADGPRISDAIVALWAGRADVDSLNRLVTAVAMPWADVAVLRAYRRYRRQIDPRYTESYVDDVLVEHADLTRSISDLFRARFGADGPDRAAATGLEASLAAGCDQVARLDHDRILRGLVGTVAATLRSNIHTRPDGPLALKLDPAAVPDMPHPVPYREIFVHGPTVEGVHLRGGPVARGGLRFSDRPEDFRTEVLDLMRTQVLKNALIVPTGAKGGFVLRGVAPEGMDRGTVVRSAYEAFVGGLLDVTDDLRGDVVVPTPGRWDDDDPYLVVAADKGTAAFSDLANRIAVDRGFWLGDAFASGGSVGYDHRALGITARGAWVAVSRHFRELDIDVATEPFTVAGVGDMSGDVFGNGMLLSDQIRLVAAFDHRDIFLDPDPDPATTLVERHRLHDLAGSSWQDFEPALISEGGGVFSRSLKRIELSRQVREALRVDAEALTPAELMQAVLRAPVDLLYLGGVGTYVRASTEADATLDDRANADLRVVAADLRARVVGEGANLGFTQPARIEYARRGGRINMDAIDNSAGVDTSDHEVNIKILVSLAIDAGLVDPADRPAVLASVTDDVVAAVLADSADQSDALRRARDASAAGLDPFEQAQSVLVAAGVLDPVIESLPDAGEYEARRRAGAGLTRPELAVLMAGTKRRVKADVLASDLPDDPATTDALVRYFPPAMAERFGPLLDRHRLRRELIASELANDLVDHLGPTLVFDLAAELELGPADVVAAYWVARGTVDSPSLWAALAAAPVATTVADLRADRADAGLVLADLLEQLTRGELVLRRRLRLEGRAHEVALRLADDRTVCADLQAELRKLERPEAERARRRLAEQLTGAGTPAALAEDLALLPELAITPDIAALGRSSGQPTRIVAPAFLALSDALGIDRLLVAAKAVPVADGWSRVARQGLIDDLLGVRREATRHALGTSGEPVVDGAEAAARWLAARQVEIDRAASVVARMQADGAVGLDSVSVAVRSLRGAIT